MNKETLIVVGVFVGGMIIGCYLNRTKTVEKVSNFVTNDKKKKKPSSGSQVPKMETR